MRETITVMADLQDDALGIYISIPFCRSKCTYCNFASGVYPASEHAHYIDRLIEDMAATGEWATRMGVDLPRRVDSVYLGGGTPSLLAPELLARLFGALRVRFSFDPDTEITMECAPGQIADETLAALVAAGVNRVSLGVQSFIDKEAQSSGRLHSRAIVLEDLRRLRAAGISNINVDLIAGLAGQTFASWQESLDVLKATGVPHASVYMLEVDEDSRLGREMLSGGARYHAELVPTDDAIAAMYTTAIETLGRPGRGRLSQYEISNFSRRGHQSRHNLRYWQRRSYLGLGLDASSMLREALADQPAPNKPAPNKRATVRSEPGYVLRATTTDDLGAYLSGPQPVETAWLSPASQHEEAWFLGLRKNAGVNVAALRREFGRKMVAPAMEVVGRMVERDLLTSDGKTVRLTAQGQLLSNDVFQEFLGLPAASAGADHLHG
ncbi:MAG: radical SAM family heme chaperone HemW [Terracidiphilus sp.]|nr:radical SAM family heme chaperone HemW [Terracidiphilus sp.]MDR3776276.1 radical SAM family heme chaperone HemW [Terracidiphilus sp.]